MRLKDPSNQPCVAGIDGIIPSFLPGPTALRQPGALLMQPLSVRCMRMLLLLRLGNPSLPIVLGRRSGTLRDQRLCRRCNVHAPYDERYLIIKCPAMQSVMDRCPALVSPERVPCMQLIMRQHDIVGLAHYIVRFNCCRWCPVCCSCIMYHLSSALAPESMLFKPFKEPAGETESPRLQCASVWF